MKLEFLKTVFKGKNKTRLLAVAGIVIILIIFLTEIIPKPSSAPKSTKSEDNYIKTTEARLTEIVSSMEGVGKTKVFITTDGSEKNIYATENKDSTDISNDKSGETSSKYNEKVTTDQKIQIIDSGGTREAILIKTELPKIIGVVVVCKGGDSKLIRDKVTQAVTTALGILSTDVYVTKIYK